MSVPAVLLAVANVEEVRKTLEAFEKESAIRRPMSREDAELTRKSLADYDEQMGRERQRQFEEQVTEAAQDQANFPTPPISTSMEALALHYAKRLRKVSASSVLGDLIVE